MPVPPKKTLVGLLALLTLAAYACGGDSCDDEAIAQEGLDSGDVVLVEDEPTETPTATEEPRETPTPAEPEPSPEPAEEPAATSTPEPTPDDEPIPTPEAEGEIINVLIDTYTWGQSQKTISLQEILGITADGFYGSGTRDAHLAELENRGLSTAGVPDDPSSSTPSPTPGSNPTPTPSGPSPTPTPGSSYTPVSITQTTLSCSDVEFDWSNPDSAPNSWQVKLDVRANVGSGNPPSSLWVTKTRTISGSASSETFTSQEFHGQNVWVTLWGNGAPYTLTISRIDNGVVSTPRTSSGLMWDDC